MTVIIHLLCGFLSTVAFGVLTNIPRKALLTCGITGASGWLVFWSLQNQGLGLGSANFLSAFVIGCLSILFSRMLKMPMIIFNIPSLVPLVPGGPAYKAIHEFVFGNNLVGLEYIMIVVITAGAIAGGFMMTSLVEKIIGKWQNAKKLKN